MKTLKNTFLTIKLKLKLKLKKNDFTSNRERKKL